LSTAETTTAKEKGCALASPGYLHKDEPTEMKSTNRRLRPMTCTAGSTRIRKINTKIFFAETEQKSTRHESNQGQANASQHLRELETKQEKRKSWPRKENLDECANQKRNIGRFKG
jgi:hypothetical protein